MSLTGMSPTGLVVGLDNGGTSNNATLPAGSGGVAAVVEARDAILADVGATRAEVRAVGLDTPGPASADGVISSKGSTNFAHPGWRNYDFRGAVEAHLGVPVVYNND